MPDHGRGGKPKAGFPPRPQSLEIAQDAISTFPQSRRGAEKWKTKTTFPTFPLVVYISKPKGALAVASLRLQAHSSMRKCSRPRSAPWPNLFGAPTKPGRGPAATKGAALLV